MSNRAVGFECPFCGHTHEMKLLRFVKDENGYLIGHELECPKCSYQWIDPVRE